MINKKRQELIIQNLRSISAEVRCMSIEQLVNLPAMPVNEKIACIQKVLGDSDESVRNAAQAALAKLSGDGEAKLQIPEPAFVAPSAPVAPPAPPDEQPVVNPPAAPVLPVKPSVGPLPGQSQTLPPAARSFQPSMPASASPATLPRPSQPLPVTPSPAAVSGSFSQGSAQPSVASNVVPAAPPELDDPVDPSLPDLKKITDISTLLQHIKTLGVKKPSGHVTQLLQLARSMLEEVALTALQTLFNLKDRRVPPQIPFMLADEQFSSQRRFLMLKIIMEPDVELNPAMLESILLKEKDVIVKSGLVKVFARSSREGGLETLIRCLQDEDPRVRANTVEVIEEQNIRGCEQNIVQLLEDPENRVKVNAAKYLVKNGFQQAFLTLRSMLVSQEVWLRDSVIFALGEIGDQPSLTLLKAALKDPNQGIRLSVLKALARINNNTSRQVLKAACGDPDPVVAQVAASLFEKIKDTPMREEMKPAAPFPQAAPPRPVQPPPAAVQPRPVSPVQVSSPIEPTRPSAPSAPEPLLPEISPAAPEPSLPSAGCLKISDLAPVEPSLPPVEDAPSQVTVPVAPRQPVAPIASARPATSLPPVVPAVSTAPSSSAMQSKTLNIPDRRLPSASTPSAGIQKPSVPARPVSSPPLASIPGMPAFAKPRSAEIYAKLCSASIDDQRAGARDLAFVMGDDQTILINKAAELADESCRIAAVKLLSRKKTPDALQLLQRLTTDPNETVRSLAEKALQLQK